MNDATSREAATEAGFAAHVHSAGRSLAGIGEVDAYLLACRRFFVRVGEVPNAAQRAVLMQQVRRGYIDAQPAEIDHTESAPDGFEHEDVSWYVQAEDWQRGQFIERVHSELAQRRIASRIGVDDRILMAHSAEMESRMDRAEREARADRAAERMDGMTIAEAADATGSTARAIRARVDRGTLRAWKGPDGKRRIPRADLEHAGLLVADNAEAMNLEQAMKGSGSGSAANAAAAPVADLSGFALVLWEKAEQAVREATEHRLLTQYAETRLREAEDTATRFESELHEARAEVAVAKHEADTLRQRLDALDSARAEIPAPEEDSTPRRRWFRRGK